MRMPCRCPAAASGMEHRRPTGRGVAPARRAGPRASRPARQPWSRRAISAARAAAPASSGIARMPHRLQQQRQEHGRAEHQVRRQRRHVGPARPGQAGRRRRRRRRPRSARRCRTRTAPARRPAAGARAGGTGQVPAGAEQQPGPPPVPQQAPLGPAHAQRERHRASSAPMLGPPCPFGPATTGNMSSPAATTPSAVAGTGPSSSAASAGGRCGARRGSGHRDHAREQRRRGQRGPGQVLEVSRAAAAGTPRRPSPRGQGGRQPVSAPVTSSTHAPSM